MKVYRSFEKVLAWHCSVYVLGRLFRRSRADRPRPFPALAPSLTPDRIFRHPPSTHYPSSPAYPTYSAPVPVAAFKIPTK